ncbi:hypothetical protein TcasGA2_TC012670 [Tribolium castaneum]|uniref:Uncharacterized protein n=1 Tax=Tribolium castaneum TaxID=7070 RepID=D6WZH6_TRICA|nr:hypothetical protein TcasGA2_TC012670 [Tribolium castaneum]
MCVYFGNLEIAARVQIGENVKCGRLGEARRPGLALCPWTASPTVQCSALDVDLLELRKPQIRALPKSSVLKPSASMLAARPDPGCTKIKRNFCANDALGLRFSKIAPASGGLILARWDAPISGVHMPIV